MNQSTNSATVLLRSSQWPLDARQARKTSAVANTRTTSNNGCQPRACFRIVSDNTTSHITIDTDIQPA
jgi:hypothetical protein